MPDNSKHGVGSGEEVAPHAMKFLGFIVVTLANADGIQVILGTCPQSASILQNVRSFHLVKK